MTIHDDFDELASAYLDGEATAEEVARVESDPELLAIVEEFRAVAAAVGAPVTARDEATRNAHIAAALGAAGASSTAPENVASLAEARARRAERQRRFLSLAAAIAAVAVGGVIVWGLVGANRGDDVASSVVDTSADAAEAASSDGADTTDAVAEAVADAADDDEAMEDDATEDDEAMAEEAMEDDAMEEEAMDEAAMEVEAAAADEAMEDDATEDDVDDAVEEAASEAEGADVRLGDDDADQDAAASTAPAEIDLNKLFGYSGVTGDNTAGESADGDATGDLAETREGLFPLPIEDRNDYIGLVGSVEELAETALGSSRSTEPSPLGGTGDGCVGIATRLQLADAATLVATATIIDDVTGQPADLAVLLIELGGVPRPIAVDVDECRIYLGADDLP